MSTSRRDFIKTASASAVALYASDIIADLLAQSPRGNVRESKFRALADIVLGEAKLAGCSYADVRFQMSVGLPGASANFNTGGRGGGGRGGGGGGRGGGRGRGGGGRFGEIPTDAARQSGGFGVRVIHSGVWGFASSPIVSADELRRVTRLAAEIARASAIAKRTDVQLAPVPVYVENYVTPMKTDPTTVSETDRNAWAQAIVDKASAVKGVTNVSVSASVTYEWRYFASSLGSYIEQEVYTTSPSFSVTASVDDETRTRTYSGTPGNGGWEIAEESDFLDAAEQVATDAVEMCTARPLGEAGYRDLVLSPAHAMLTIHEIVGHPTELDRVVGYEANYAGTSFIRLGDVGKLKYGSPHFNVTATRTDRGLASMGYDDDGVKTSDFPIVRDGILVGLQTNRETAHFLGEETSRGCTYAGSWRDYPFLRMPNVHVDAGPAGSPTRDEMIADVKDGVMIDGRGSYSIDQQRYNGQFGGHIFWEIKNGKITRQVTDVTYNAITTDFFANLDAVGGPEEWRMHGTSGDAKGQPTQINTISHGSPWMLIRRIMVGAAFR